VCSGIDQWYLSLQLAGQEYTIGHSAYAPGNLPSEKQSLHDQAAQTPLSRTEVAQQQMYNQPKLISELLQRMSKSNEKVLKGLTLSFTHNLEDHKPKDLHRLALLGAENSKLSWKVWQAVWKELTSPSQGQRPPVLVALDGIDHWMTLSKYRSAEYNPIHAHQLAPIRHFLDVLFNKDGAGQLANGGMILAATTGSNTPSVPTFELLLKQLEAQERGLKIGDSGFPMPEPYQAVDQRVLDLLAGSNELHVQKLKGLEKDVEARGLLEYFAKSGVMREAVSVTSVGEKWSLAGGGVIGEMARFGKRLRA
jgi:small subunit ribosomal protein S29